MMRSRLLAIATIAVTLASCSKKEAPGDAKSADTASVASKPADAIMRVVAAMNARDTTAFLAALSKNRRHMYAEHPGSLANSLELWKRNHYEITHEADSINGNTGVVFYTMKVTGDSTYETTLSPMISKEDGVWKFGQ